jgi:hypothetical protein
LRSDVVLSIGLAWIVFFNDIAFKAVIIVVAILFEAITRVAGHGRIR